MKVEMPMTVDESEKRQAIIDACRRMNELGINQGTSGNISLRHQDGMLVTPTSVPYEQMRPEQIVFMHFDGSFAQGQKPSSEWRFHLDILRSRSEVNAVVHAHPPYATILNAERVFDTPRKDPKMGPAQAGARPMT